MGGPAGTRRLRGSQTVRKALIIDDERNMRLVFEEALSETHDCAVVCNGREGFQLAIQQPGYDVIVMDLAMPEWNGMDALAMIQTMNPSARVIVCSGEISPEQEQELDHLSCVRRVLRKPVRMPEFIQAVTEVEAE